MMIDTRWTLMMIDPEYRPKLNDSMIFSFLQKTGWTLIEKDCELRVFKRTHKGGDQRVGDEVTGDTVTGDITLVFPNYKERGSPNIFGEREFPYLCHHTTRIIETLMEFHQMSFEALKNLIFNVCSKQR